MYLSREEFKLRQEEKIRAIESILTFYLPEKSGYQELIMDAMEYSVMAGGKRLRPMMMNEVYHLFGGKDREIEPFMAAIEMIHTYSLVHDDLPAMDNDEYRRGRKTTHVVYGEDMGILAGDALLNFAFETAIKAFDMKGAHQDRIAKALQVLANKAGIYGMIGGQVIDVKESGNVLPLQMLDEINRLKTAALIECAMMCGAILAGTCDDHIAVVEQIAGKVGMAFQIQDDILDVTSTTEVLGKPVHSDEKNDKNTYVAILGIEKCKEIVSRLSKEAEDMLRTLPGENLYLNDLLLSLINREK